MYFYKDKDSKKDRVCFSNAGWYYDRELNNPMTCCSLHPNRKFNGDIVKTRNTTTKDEGGKEVTTTEMNERTTSGWQDLSDDEKLYDEKSFMKIDDSFKYGSNGSLYGYGKEPICSSILTEDFNVTIANEWQEFGGDPIGELWKTVKPYAPYAKQFASAVKEMSASQNSLTGESKDKVESSTVASLLSGAVDYLADNSGDLSSFLNRNLVCQGTRFAYYNGTGVEFSNLAMRFTLFPKWERDEHDVLKFISVVDQVKKIYPYVMGTFATLEDLKTGKDADQRLYNYASEYCPSLKEMIGWELPPGGFEADVKYIDATQAGTLLLRIGPQYQLNNLVISNANFTFSKQMVKNPAAFQQTDVRNANYQGWDVLFSPLYCDVVLALRPVTKYSTAKLDEFVSGWSRNTSKVETHMSMIASLKRKELEITNSYKNNV